MQQCDRLQLKKPLRVFPKQHKPHAFQVDTSKGFWVWGFSIHDDEGLMGKHQTIPGIAIAVLGAIVAIFLWNLMTRSSAV